MITDLLILPLRRNSQISRHHVQQSLLTTFGVIQGNRMEVKRLVLQTLDVVDAIEQQARLECFVNTRTITCIVLPVTLEICKALN